MTVLVTGAGSYIAQAIIRRLCQMRVDVLATYRTHYPYSLRGVRLIKLDLCDQSGYSKLPRGVEAIIHVAAGTPRHTVSDILLSCTQGLSYLKRYALDSGAGALVITSSISIHGRIENPIVNEITPIIDPDIYGASKLLVERSFAGMADRLPVIALRLPSVLSRLETEAWVPTLMRKLLVNEDIEVYNPEAKFNNAIDIDELSRFVVSLITKPFGGFHAFPIASSGAMTIAEIVELLRNSVKSKSVITINKNLRNSFTISSEYASKFLGYAPIEIHQTINRFVERVKGFNS